MNSPKIKNKIVAYETVKIEQTKTIVKKPLFHFSFTLYIYVYIYIYNGGKLQYKECEQMRALTEGWRKHK